MLKEFNNNSYSREKMLEDTFKKLNQPSDVEVSKNDWKAEFIPDNSKVNNDNTDWRDKFKPENNDTQSDEVKSYIETASKNLETNYLSNDDIIKLNELDKKINDYKFFKDSPNKKKYPVFADTDIELLQKRNKIEQDELSNFNSNTDAYSALKAGVYINTLKEIHDTKPKMAFSDFVGDTVSKEGDVAFATTFGLSGTGLSTLKDRVDSGNKNAIKTFSDKYDKYQNEYMTSKYGDKWTDEDLAFEGVDNVANAVSSSLKEEFSNSYNDNRNFVEQLFDGISMNAASTASGAAEFALQSGPNLIGEFGDTIHTGVETIPGIPDGLYVEPEFREQVKNELVSDYIDPLQVYTKSTMEADKGLTAGTSQLVGELLPYVAGGIAISGAKVGAGAANATRSSLGLAEGASVSKGTMNVSQEFLINASDYAVEAAIDSVIASGMESAVTDEAYGDVFKRNIMYAALGYGAFKGIQHGYKPALDKAGAALGYSAAKTANAASATYKAYGNIKNAVKKTNTYKATANTAAAKYTSKQLNTMKSKSNEYIKKALKGLDNANINKEGLKKLSGAIQGGIIKAYEVASKKIKSIDYDFSALENNSAYKRLSPEDQLSVKSLVDRGIDVNDILDTAKKAGSMKEGLLQIEDELKKSYKSFDSEYVSQQGKLDNIEKVHINKLKKLIEKLPKQQMAKLSETNSIDAFRKVLQEAEGLNYKERIYRDRALNTLKGIQDRINAVVVVKDGEHAMSTKLKTEVKNSGKTSINTGNLFMSMYGNASILDGDKGWITKLGEYTGFGTKESSQNSISIASKRSVAWEDRMRYASANKHFVNAFFLDKPASRLHSGNVNRYLESKVQQIQDIISKGGLKDLSIKDIDITKKITKKQRRVLKQLSKGVNSKAFDEAYLVDRNVAKSVRESASAIGMYEFNVEHIRSMDKAAELSADVGVVSQRSAIHHGIELTNTNADFSFVTDAGENFKLHGDTDIAIKVKDSSGVDTYLVNGRKLSEDEVANLKLVPDEIIEKLEQSRLVLSEVSKTTDNIIKESGVMSVDDMSDSIYIETRLTDANGVSLGDKSNSGMLQEVRVALAEAKDREMKIRVDKKQYGKTSDKSHYKNFQLSSKRDEWINTQIDAYNKKYGKNVRSVKTNTDPFEGIMSYAARIPDKLKRISMSKELHAIRRSNNVKSVYTNEGVDSFIDEALEDIPELKEFEQQLKKSSEDTTNSNASIFNRLDEIEATLTNASEGFNLRRKELGDTALERVSNKIEELKKGVEIFKSKINLQIDELQAKGFKDAGEIMKMKEFNGLYLSPSEARGLTNLVTDARHEAVKIFTKGVNFHKQFVASGDFFMTFKTVYAAASTSGVSAAIKQLKKNIQDISVLIKSGGEGVKTLQINDTFQDMVKAYSKYGGVKNVDMDLLFNPIEKIMNDLGRYNNLDQGAVKNTINKIGSKAEDFVEWFKLPEELQFKAMLPLAKATAWDSLVKEMTEKRMNAINKNKKFGERVYIDYKEGIDAEDIRVQAAEAIDNMFTSQNWDVIKANSNHLTDGVLKSLPLVFFASDFLTSKLGQLRMLHLDLFDFKTIKGDIARNIAFKTATNLITTMQFTSLLINGHTTLENESGEWWKLKMGNMTDAQGNPIYMNPIGVTAQALTLASKPVSSIGNQLSVPLGGAVGLLNRNNIESKDADWKVSMVSNMLIPMSYQGPIDTALIGDMESHRPYGVSNSMSEALLRFTLDMFGMETGAKKSNDEVQNMYQAINPFTSEEGKITKSTSYINEIWHAFTGKKLPNTYKANGLEGDTKLERIQNGVETGNLDSIAQSIKDQDNIDERIAIDNGGVYEQKFHQKEMRLALGAMIAKHMQEGVTYPQALDKAREEYKSSKLMEVPTKNLFNTKIISRNTINQLSRTTMSDDAIIAIYGTSNPGKVYNLMKNPEAEEDLLKHLEEQLALKKITSNQFRELKISITNAK